MEGIHVVESSGSERLNNRKKEQNDRISELPDSVLVHILSFMPTKDVAKMVLVPRFRHYWTFIRSLSFDHCQYHDCMDDSSDAPVYDERFLNLINHVLIHHESSVIDKFHIKFAFALNYSLGETWQDDPNVLDYVTSEKRMANKIYTWVCFAVRKKVKFLNLDLLGCSYCEPEVSYELPYIVLNSNHVIELKLASFIIKPRGQIQLKSLKNLSLSQIMLSDKIMDDVINGCPLLTELSVTECFGLSKLSCTNPNLQSLVVIIWCFQSMRLKISCRHVISLHVAGSLEYAHLEDVSSVVDASLYFSYCFKCGLKKYQRVKMLLEKLGNTMTFAPCTWCILVLTIWKLTNLPCPSFSWKCLVLKINLIKWHLPGIFTLLGNSHCLETLTIYVEPGSHHIFVNVEAHWIQAYDFNGGNYLNMEEPSFHCLKHHLKTVRIYGYITEPYVIELVEFLLKHAMVLETMVISTKQTFQPIHPGDFAIAREKNHFTSEKLLEFSQKLLTFPRASTRAIINFS